MKESLISKIENDRASFAFECADKVDKDLKKTFKSHVKSFPMLIKTNGLGSAIAFLFSKKDSEKGVYETVGMCIVKWLNKDKHYETFGLSDFKNIKELAEKIINLDSTSYKALTAEILSFFKWLRRFAEGLYKGDNND